MHCHTARDHRGSQREIFDELDPSVFCWLFNCLQTFCISAFISITVYQNVCLWFPTTVIQLYTYVPLSIWKWSCCTSVPWMSLISVLVLNVLSRLALNCRHIQYTVLLSQLLKASSRTAQLHVNWHLEYCCSEPQISQSHLTGVSNREKPPCDPLSVKVSFNPF